MTNPLIDRFLGSVIKKGHLTVTMASGEVHTLGTPTEGYPEVAIRLIDKRVVRDILLDPRLGAGEAYMDGRIVIEEGDIMSLVQLLRMNSPWERGGMLRPPSPLRRVKDGVKFLRTSFNQAASSKRNVSHHYDIGNDLYRLMLDPEHMQYSCAYWAPGVETLAQAQEAKLAHIAAKLALSDGQRVLDIGCGWGGMAIFLAQHFDVRVTGITLSEEQLVLAKERAGEAGVSDRVSFELVDYRDLAARGERFDRIVSVGMFEHVGRPQFETFFRSCANLLTDDGVMLIHTIGRFGGPGKMYSCAVRDIGSLGKDALDPYRHRNAAVALRQDLARLVRQRRGEPRGDHRTDGRALLSHVDLLPLRCDRSLRKRRNGQLPDPVRAQPPRFADHARLHDRSGETPARPLKAMLWRPASKSHCPSRACLVPKSHASADAS